MPATTEQLEAFVKRANEKKYAKKKSRKTAFEDYKKWKDGKYDQETGLPRPPTRLRRK